MKHIFFFFVMFAMVNVAFGQQDVPEDGFGLPVPGSVPDTMKAWIDECTFSLQDEGCTVTVYYTSNLCPVTFFQNGEPLESISSEKLDEKGTRREVLRGVEFETVGDGYSYMIELRNPKGSTYLIRSRRKS